MGTRAWIAANRERLREYRRQYYRENREREIASSSRRAKVNPRPWKPETPDQRERRKQRHYARLKSDPAYRACKNVRVRIRNFMAKGCQWSKSLGCSQEEFRKWIESQFQQGMTWDNYGEWEIDHKVPLSRAYEQGPESFAVACKYTNLQPLWRLDNIRKSNR